MPEKDGDEGKSAKSVVNKKQKQMMGEEGYDIARDMGRVRPSKDKKDATTLPPSKEMEKTRKVNKGPSALDVVKKKYKGQIMKMEELDLTQVAEAFGGYIVESNGDDEKKLATDDKAQRRKRQARDAKKLYIKRLKDLRDKDKGVFDNLKTTTTKNITKKIGTVIPGEEEGTKAAIRTAVDQNVGGAETPAGRERLAKISARSKIGPDTVAKFKKSLKQMKTGTRPVDDSTIRGMGTETDREMDVRSQASKSDASRLAYNRYARELRRPEYDPLKPRKPRTIPFKDKPQLDTETQKKVDAVTPPFATKQGETGPLPVSMRNRRVPKTSSLSPNINVTSIVKPKVGALTQTDTATNNIVRTGRKSYRDFVIDPEIVQQVKPKQTTVIAPEKEGETIDVTPERETQTQTQTGRRTRTGTPTKTDIKKLKPPKIYGYLAPEIKKPEKTDEPISDPIGGGDPPNKKTKVGNFSYRPGGAFSRIRGFARRNPVLSLVGYDALKNLRAPSVTKPTKTGRVSAGT